MRFSGPQYSRENEAAAPRAKWPGFEQLPLPGMGSGQSEQMRLFDTHRAGPSSIYALNPSMDAAHWVDRDKEVELDDDEREILESDGEITRGVFYDWGSPSRSSEREYLANAGAFGRKLKSVQREEGTYLGSDAYPERANPDLTFEELDYDEDDTFDQMGGTRTYFTPEGTEVGKVTYHEDEWGPYVDTAEINPLYKGRKFSKDAIAHFAGTAPVEGVLHAGSYSEEGERAFHAKGIPTTNDIEHAFAEHIEGFDPDEETVRELAMEQYPDEDIDFWVTDEAEGYLSEIRENLRYDMQYNDPYARDDFKSHLTEIQAGMLRNLEGSKPGSFIPGFKPKGKTWGTQEKMF